MPQPLRGKRFAILATDGFEQQELRESRRALQDAGAAIDVVSPRRGRIVGWDVDNWGQEVHVDVSLDQASAGHYDGLMLPGGHDNPDHLRMSPPALRFIREFFLARKPVAAICHAPAVLVDAGVLPGRRLTSFPAIKADIRNAGGQWLDQPVVSEDGLVTARSSEDLEHFTRAMVSTFAAGQRSPAAAAVDGGR